MKWASDQSLWVPRSVRMIDPTTQITYQTLTIAKSRVFLNFLRFLRYEDKIVPVRASVLSIRDRFGCVPRLSPEKTPKIISYTTNYYKQLCNQLIFAINHLFRFIPRVTEHPPIWSLHHRIVLSRAFQMVPHSSQSGKNGWSYGLDGFGWHSECSNSALMDPQAFVVDETS